MSRFGPEPRTFFEAVYAEQAPWDVGGPQPALMDLLRTFPPASPILDVGCGSGDLAIALAKEGHRVLGVDFVPTAVEQGRVRGGSLATGPNARLSFTVGDALHPSRLGHQFGAVVDSGFFHLFEPKVCDRFIDDLGLALSAGGHYYLLAFAVTFPIPHGPRAVTEDEVRTRFTRARGWEVRACHAAELLSRAGNVPATCACIERVPQRRTSPTGSRVSSRRAHAVRYSRFNEAVRRNGTRVGHRRHALHGPRARGATSRPW